MQGAVSGEAEAARRRGTFRPAKPFEGNLFKRRPICTSIGLLVSRGGKLINLSFSPARGVSVLLFFISFSPWPGRGEGGGGGQRLGRLVSNFSKVAGRNGRFVSTVS